VLRYWSTSRRNQPRCESLLLEWELEYYLLLDRRNDPQQCSRRAVERSDKTRMTDWRIQVGNGRNLHKKSDILQDPWGYDCKYSNELEKEWRTYQEESL